MTNIQIGILGRPLGWRTLLGQEGIPHIVLKSPEEFDKCSALVVSDLGERRMLEAVRGFLSNGGSLVCSSECFDILAGTTSPEVFIRYVTGRIDDASDPVWLVDLFSECRIPQNANGLLTDAGKLCVFTGEYGGGDLVVLPFDPAQMILDTRTASKSFYAPRKRLPYERVSLVSRGGIRRIVARALERLHHRKGLPYIHSWYYPGLAPSVFGFRVDTDYGAQREIESLKHAIRRHEFPITWFVHVGSHRDFLSMFANMGLDEIGLHCYTHSEPTDFGVASSDIRRGLDLMRSQGINIQSYAAPFGVWNEPLARAIASFGFEYSSEFSYDYDNLPTWPSIGYAPSTVLQVPIHPVSIGSLRRQGFRESEMVEYFHALIEMKILAHDPLFIYHHPKDGHTTVLDEVFSLVKSSKIPTIRMIDYALWWKARTACDLRFEVAGSSIACHSSITSPDLGLRISRMDGMEALILHDTTIRMDDVKWERRAELPPVPPDIGRIRTFNPWISVNRLEDTVSRLIRPRNN